MQSEDYQPKTKAIDHYSKTNINMFKKQPKTAKSQPKKGYSISKTPFLKQPKQLVFKILMKSINRSVYKLIMSSQIQTVSQLSQLKIASNAHKCQVFCQVNSSLQKYEISVDDSTSVSAIIGECLQLIKKAQRALGLDIQFLVCELYASKKSGKKISDFPSLESQQKILKTGLKAFYLQFEQKLQKKKTNISSVSTKSIQSDMKVQKNKSNEMQAAKQYGCFCF